MLHRKASLLGLMAVLAAGFAPGGEAIPNWSAPATWTPTKSSGVHTMTDVTGALPFTGITPCRVADTRGNGFTGTHGPPSLVANAQRSFFIAGVIASPCGIPANASAVSFNFTALNISGAGDLRVFPAGGGTPLVSTLNYNANTPNIANAAVVPLGTAGAITLQADAVSIDLVIDVNGYYTYNLNNGQTLVQIGDCSSCSIVYGENDSASGGSPTSGVRGRIFGSGAGAAGVLGESGGTSGNTYGVFGKSGSQTAFGISAGVAGVDYTGSPVINPAATSNAQAGVYGLSASKVGVEGDSGSVGVRGRLMNGSGDVVHVGLLGFSSYGVFSTGDFAATGTKSFVEPHATDPGKVIRFVALEGNESGTYFRGSARFVNGSAVISVPEEFRMVSDEDGLTVQLTPVGAAASMFVVSLDLSSVVVRSNRDVKFFYQVNGVRRAYKDFVPVAEGQEFMPYSPSAVPLASYPAEIQQRLVANGTYNADGSINRETAQRLGWDKARDKAAEAGAARKTAADPQP